jgi:ketosteroid isomerase-like protein
MTTIEDQTAASVAAVGRFSAAFDRHDVEGVMAGMSADCRFESTGPPPDGGVFTGAAAVRQVWQRLFHDTPDATFVTEEQFVAGDRGILRWRYDWGPGHVRGVDVFRVRDGLVTEKLSHVKG